MQLDRDLPEVLKVDQRTISRAAVAGGRELNCIEAVAPLEAGVSRRLAALEPTKERRESAVQAARRTVAWHLDKVVRAS